jgi:hypothetical protein
MTQVPHMGDLRTRYERSANSPVMKDDYVNWERVIGFALTREPVPADQMLVEGDEDLAGPPKRPVPRPSDPADIRRTGALPVHSMPPGCLHHASGRVDEAFERQLSALGEAGELVRSVLHRIADRQHLAWLVGGATRDLLANPATAKVNDLDFTGTIGPSELCEIAPLRRVGAGDYEWQISPRLVWSVREPSTGARVIEYKPLSRTGLRFPAWGGDLREDAATRDLTVNALYYDFQKKVVADPTARGLADLNSTPRIAATPYRGDDPVELACLILRWIKFQFRWPGLNITEIAERTRNLPRDLANRILEHEWKLLLSLRNRSIPKESRGAKELRQAAELGPVAVRLIETIQHREKLTGEQ